MILKIKNRRVEFFNNFKLDLRYDSVASAFSFNFLFNPNDADLLELVHLGHYHKMTLEHNDELLLTGYILNQTFRDGNQKSLSGISGYSLPGVLEDCQIPTSVYPLQSDKLSLHQIVNKLVAPFKLKVVVDPAVASKMNKVYSTSTADENQTIKAYICELAAQRNIIVTHNEQGHLLFTEAKTKQQPFMHFDRGVPGVNMAMNFNGQGMHSHITVQKQADSGGGNAGESTIANPFVPYTYRPKVLSQSSGDDIDTATAARRALSDELKNLQLQITTDRWQIDGKIIKPNTVISVKNPELFLKEKMNWFVESISFEGTQEKTIATLNCVLPEAYNNAKVVNHFEH